VFLDQLLLQYWFHGPLDGTVTESDNGTGTDGSGVSDVVARVSASQFRLTCSDATQELGKGHIEVAGCSLATALLHRNAIG